MPMPPLFTAVTAYASSRGGIIPGLIRGRRGRPLGAVSSTSYSLQLLYSLFCEFTRTSKNCTRSVVAIVAAPTVGLLRLLLEKLEMLDIPDTNCTLVASVLSQ